MKRFLIILVFLSSCNNSNPEKEALQTVTNFLGWYNENYNDANSFILVNQDSAYYSVNFEQTEKFLSYLKSSGYVTGAYLNHFRAYFKDAETTFQKDSINEGPPPGFDYDIVLYTQEPELVIEKRKNPIVLSKEIKDDTIILNLNLELPLQFQLSKQNAKWMIDRIQYFDQK